MKMLIRAKDGKRLIEIDDADEVSVVVNPGLTLGYGPDGITFCLTPTPMPTIAYQFTWGEVMILLLNKGRRNEVDPSDGGGPYGSEGD